MDFSERVIPNISANFLFQEALARYAYSIKYIKNSKKVLDFGCGTGYGTAFLGRKSFAMGIDINSDAIKYAQSKYGRGVTFVKGDVRSIMKLDNDEFDFISSFEVIEHLDNPKLFLSEIKRIVKKDGYFILSTPNKLVHSPDGIMHSKYHKKEYSPNELSILLKKYFSDVTILGQYKSIKARTAIKEFLQSQKVRQKYVDIDYFGIRKLIPKTLKESLWRFVGNIYGRRSQNDLDISDFKIGRVMNDCEYIIGVCQK